MLRKPLVKVFFPRDQNHINDLTNGLTSNWYQVLKDKKENRDILIIWVGKYREYLYDGPLSHNELLNEYCAIRTLYPEIYKVSPGITFERFTMIRDLLQNKSPIPFIQQETIEFTKKHGYHHVTHQLITFQEAKDIAKVSGFNLYEEPLKLTFCTKKYASQHMNRKCPVTLN